MSLDPKKLLTAGTIAFGATLGAAQAQEPTQQDRLLDALWDGKKAEEFCVRSLSKKVPGNGGEFLRNTLNNMKKISPIVAASLERLNNTKTFDGETVIFCGSSSPEWNNESRFYIDSGVVTASVSDLIKGANKKSPQELFESISLDAAESIFNYLKATNGSYFGFDLKTGDFSFIIAPTQSAMEAAYVIAYAHQGDLYDKKLSLLDSLSERPGYKDLVDFYRNSEFFRKDRVSLNALRDVVQHYMDPSKPYLVAGIQQGNRTASHQTTDKFNASCNIPPDYIPTSAWIKAVGDIPELGNVLTGTETKFGSFATHLELTITPDALINGLTDYLRTEKNISERAARMQARLTVKGEQTAAVATDRQKKFMIDTGADCTGVLYGQTPVVSDQPVQRPK